VKRQKEVKDLSTTRLREGDSVLAAVAGSTRATMVFFSNFGVAYTSRIVDVPASTGYGDPVQKLFKLKDGEKIVAAFSLDPRIAKKIEAKKEGDVPPLHAIAVTSDGYAMRFSLQSFVEVEHAIRPPLRAHREGAEVVNVG
jgi:DNA gyrase subunit A